MGTPSKKVWELARSLTKAERKKFYDRAFERKRGRYAKYVRLFDVLKVQAVYDEAAVKEELKDEGYFRNLNKTKNYLYNRILEFVRDTEHDGESELNARLENIKFLFEKRLYGHLPKLLDKAEKLAEDIEAFADHLKVLEYRRELLIRRRSYKNLEAKTGHLREKEAVLLELSLEKTKLNQLLARCYTLTGKGIEDEAVQQIATEITELKPRSRSGKIILCRCKHFLALAGKDYQQCLDISKEIMLLFETNTDLLQATSNFYTWSYSIYSTAAYHVYFNEFDKGREVLKKLALVKDREPVLYWERRIMFELSIARKTLDQKAASLAIERFDSLPERIKSKMEDSCIIMIFHIISITKIIFGEFKAALKFVLQIPVIGTKEDCPKIKFFSRILFLVIHFELSNFDLVENSVRAARIAISRSGQ